MAKTYSEKLLDPRWQKKRLEILNRDSFSCQKCGNEKNTLHVHHRYYINKLEPWEYSNKSLITLCKDCHEFETEFKGHLKTFGIDNFLNSDFLPSHIYDLSTAFEELYSEYSPYETIKIIKYALSNEDLMNFLASEYYDNNPDE